MYSYVDKVKWFGLYSRLFICVVQYLSNTLFSDHDAKVFLSPNDPNLRYNRYDRIIHAVFDGYIKWDGQYFWHIARYGYTYEQTLAFFPLFPIAAKSVGYAFHALGMGVINKDSACLLAIFAINTIVFVKSAQKLYHLTYAVFKNEQFAYISAILFCVNPSSIFFSAAYSETVFSYLTFSAMFAAVTIHHKQNRPRTQMTNMSDSVLYCISFSLPCGLSALTRSNGLINLGFYAYFWLIRLKSLKMHNVGVVICLMELFNMAVQLVINTLISVAPFALFQVYSYDMFCRDFNTTHIPDFLVAHAESHKFRLPGNYSLYQQRWCTDTLPLAYSYVQNSYWNVGLLHYYQLKQVPNFLLAMPIVCMTLAYAVKTFRFALNFTLAFLVHAVFLTIFALLFMHIQVATRLLCAASPIVYWYAAELFLNQLKRNDMTCVETRVNFASQWRTFLFSAATWSNIPAKVFAVEMYFLGYAIIGTVLFSNFLPWT